MLLEVKTVEDEHFQPFREGNLGEAYRSATLGCVRLIEKVVLGGNYNDDRATQIVRDLGIRMINDSGAAS